MRKRGRLLFALPLALLLAAPGWAADVEPAPEPVVTGTAVDCVVATTSTTEPKNPYKKPDGYYDQGSAGACLFTSLVNANIKAGADDTGGKFFKRFRLCLFKKGQVNSWRRGVVAVPSPEYDVMLRCKEEARAANTSAPAVVKTEASSESTEAEPVVVAATEVKLKVLPATEPWATREQAICDALSTTPPGAATIVTTNGTQVHSSSVESIDCAANEMVIRDPNGGTYTLTYDDTGKITGCSPANAHYNGATIGAVTVETTGP